MEQYLQKDMEMRGIEPRAFHMRSERSTTELHPLLLTYAHGIDLNHNGNIRQ